MKKFKFRIPRPAIVMFDICKIEPWVPVRDEIDIAFDEAFDRVHQSFEYLSEQLIPLSEALAEATDDLSKGLRAWCESASEQLSKAAFEFLKENDFLEVQDNDLL